MLTIADLRNSENKVTQMRCVPVTQVQFTLQAKYRDFLGVFGLQSKTKKEFLAVDLTKLDEFRKQLKFLTAEVLVKVQQCAQSGAVDREKLKDIKLF
jgi:hypothetical protein